MKKIISLLFLFSSFYLYANDKNSSSDTISTTENEVFEEVVIADDVKEVSLDEKGKKSKVKKLKLQPFAKAHITDDGAADIQENLQIVPSSPLSFSGEINLVSKLGLIFLKDVPYAYYLNSPSGEFVGFLDTSKSMLTFPIETVINKPVLVGARRFKDKDDNVILKVFQIKLINANF